MSPLETLAALSRGDPAAARGLLPACRAQAFGAEAFGPAAIVELFARGGVPLSPSPSAVLAPRTLWLSDADLDGCEQAWVADLYEGRIGRLWRVGEGGCDPTAEPALAFAADPFLTQARDPVALRAQDHPDLAADAAPALAAAAERAARGPDTDTPMVQGRAFVLRAASEGDRGGALLAVSGPSTGVSAQRLAAVGFRFAGAETTHLRIVWDADRPSASLARLTLTDV